MIKLFSVNRILWAVYLSLLGVLLPHTAWAFHNFEPENESGKISLVAWTAAFAFEASIAALMHKLSGHIDRTPRRLSPWAKFQYRYLNAYSLGLLAAIAVSSLANLAHAVEFGRPLAIFAVLKISFDTYAFAFGAVLPLVSLVFARVLSNVVETEGDEDPELVQAKKTISDLRHQLRESEAKAKAAEEADRRPIRIGRRGALENRVGRQTQAHPGCAPPVAASARRCACHHRGRIAILCVGSSQSRYKCRYTERWAGMKIVW